MLVPCCLDVSRKAHDFCIDGLQVDGFFRLCGADIAGDIQVVAVRFYLLHRHAPRVALFFLAELVGVDDLVDVFGQ